MFNTSHHCGEIQTSAELVCCVCMCEAVLDNVQHQPLRRAVCLKKKLKVINFLLPKFVKSVGFSGKIFDGVDTILGLVLICA